MHFRDELLFSRKWKDNIKYFELCKPKFLNIFRGQHFQCDAFEVYRPNRPLFYILFPFRILWLQYEWDFRFFFLIINCKYSQFFLRILIKNVKNITVFFKFGNIRSLFSSKIHRNLVSYDICLNIQFFFNLTSNYFHF